MLLLGLILLVQPINQSMNYVKRKDGSSNENPLSRPNLKGEVEFKNVSFTYPGANEPTLKDLSFKIKPGEKVAILGKMGSESPLLLDFFQDSMSQM